MAVVVYQVFEGQKISSAKTSFALEKRILSQITFTFNDCYVNETLLVLVNVTGVL